MFDKFGRYDFIKLILIYAYAWLLKTTYIIYKYKYSHIYKYTHA